MVERVDFLDVVPGPTVKRGLTDSSKPSKADNLWCATSSRNFGENGRTP
jgi:hypothetical protein